MGVYKGKQADLTTIAATTKKNPRPPLIKATNMNDFIKKGKQRANIWK